MKTQAANKKRQATTGKQLPPQAGGSRSQRILREALLENETMLACLVRKSPVGMFVLRNGKFIQVSETLADIFGYDRKEILQFEAFADLAAISSREKLQKLLSKRGRSSQDLQMTFSGMRRDGPTFDCELRATRLPFKGKTIIVGAVLEVSQAGASTARGASGRTGAEERQESGPHCRLRLEDAMAPALIVQDGYVGAFNRLACELVGCDEQALSARGFIELFHPDDQGRVQKYLTGESAIVESAPRRLLSGTGEIRWVELNRCKTDWQGAPALLFLLNDVTDAKLAQDEFARTQRLESAGRVAGQIAHDFNNLLSPMAAYPALIREELGADHPAADMLDAIEKGTNTLTEIIQQLLALGRRSHYTPAPVDLNALAHKVLLAECLPPNIEVVEKLRKNMLPVKGSEAQLARVVVNLVRNAAEAMRGRGRLTCATEHTYLDRPLTGYQMVQRGEYATLRISDTGDGIDPENLQRIFDPFYTTKRSAKRRGAGLGLSVACAIATEHDAYISVESQRGLGTTFSIFFPIVREVTTDAEAPANGMEGGRERILVIDDDPVQGEVASNLLKRLGYRVQVLTDGESAVKHIREEHYDLIVLDMVMGRGIDGAEIYRQILEIEPHQPAIVWSGHAMSERVQAALQLGAGTFVTKPVSRMVLAEAVRRELDKKKQPSGGR